MRIAGVAAGSGSKRTNGRQIPPTRCSTSERSLWNTGDPLGIVDVMRLETLGMTIPLIQAPMAGVSTPELAAAVSNAGALGSIAIGAMDLPSARSAIAEVRARTSRPFLVNVFTHRTPTPDRGRETAWLDALAPLFEAWGGRPPEALRTIYTSFSDDPAMLALLCEVRPAVVSSHFGLPSSEAIDALKRAGVLLVATATSLDEARACEDAGVDAIVAQGIEAGGHRGVFDPSAPDDALGTFALTRLLVRRMRVPVIAAGGIMDGAGIAASIALGAVAAQLGTAFIACPESSADEGYRKALAGASAHHTRLTRVVSGRPARSLASRFTAFGEAHPASEPPDYPIAYDAGKQLHALAKARGEHGFGAHWAGQGAPLARALPAKELVAVLDSEYRASTKA